MADQRVFQQGQVQDYGVLTATGNYNPPGFGSAFELPFISTTYTMQTVTTSVSAISIKLQGSLDGVNWYDLLTSTATAGDAQFITGKPAKFLRIALGTLTGTNVRPFVAFTNA